MIVGALGGFNLLELKDCSSATATDLEPKTKKVQKNQGLPEFVISSVSFEEH